VDGPLSVTGTISGQGAVPVGAVLGAGDRERCDARVAGKAGEPHRITGRRRGCR